MKILMVLTYYRPHTSGLTIYVERLSRALTALGHKVTILTSHHDTSCMPVEEVEGVRVVRAPVFLKISKGVIMPTFPFLAYGFAKDHDLVHFHLPQFDAGYVSAISYFAGKPSIITYHCDLLLPDSFFNNIINKVVHLMNTLALRLASNVVGYTRDFAESSPFLSKFSHKLNIVSPPVELPEADPYYTQSFLPHHNVNRKGPYIAMATRLAAEKGVEVLLDAMPAILEKYPDAVVLFAGQYKNVLAEKDYEEKVMPLIKKYISSDNWRFLGVLNPREMASFYKNIDILTVPSLNSTESFGLVQIEAMMNRVPVVASNLPGVRQPVLTTGNGKVVPIGDSKALGEALVHILDNLKEYKENIDLDGLRREFSPNSTALKYENIYKAMII